MNIDIDEVLLVDKNKGLGVSSFRVISLCNPWFSFLIFILIYNFRNLFIFCINVDTDKMLLLDKNKGLGSISL